MNVEPSRQQEIMAHVWFMPKGMKPREAREFFDRRFKPTGFVYEKFSYDPLNGRTVTG
ncbi:MAG: hypothetical protein ACRDL7_00080 [Gaiellaceae bacterium]